MSHYALDGLLPPKSFTRQEQQLLLRATAQRRGAFRDHMLIALALGTGLREFELVALNIGDVFDAAGNALTRVLLRIFKRSAKRPAPQQVFLNATLRAKLGRYYRYLRKQRRGLADDAPLFVSRKRSRLSTRQLRRLIKVWQRRAGVTADCGFHALRHTACMNMQRKCGDIRLVQRFARHASLRSTQVYTQPTDEDVLAAVADLLC